MSTIEATVSMMEVMPEETRLKIFEYAQQLFGLRKASNPFAQRSTSQILADLDRAHGQIEAGLGIPADEMMEEIGRLHPTYEC